MVSKVMRLPMRLSFGCMYQKVLDYIYYQKAKSGLAASGLYIAALFYGLKYMRQYRMLPLYNFS